MRAPDGAGMSFVTGTTVGGSTTWILELSEDRNAECEKECRNYRIQ